MIQFECQRGHSHFAACPDFYNAKCGSLSWARTNAVIKSPACVCILSTYTSKRLSVCFLRQQALIGTLLQQQTKKKVFTCKLAPFTFRSRLCARRGELARANRCDPLWLLLRHICFFSPEDSSGSRATGVGLRMSHCNSGDHWIIIIIIFTVENKSLKKKKKRMNVKVPRVRPERAAAGAGRLPFVHPPLHLPQGGGTDGAARSSWRWMQTGR